ncbi:MAG: hypothetical protein IKN96_08370 [Oscillibacter sp.]|nr:hypothetical protein [Oscillibacter sp.]
MVCSLQTTGKRILTLALCALALSAALFARAAAEPGLTEEVVKVPAQAVGEDGKPFDVTVDQHTFVFSDVPASAADIARYKLDSPYKTMALLIMAFRTWAPENPNGCLQMLDYLTDTESVFAGTEEKCPFSQYKPWISALQDRMTQNDKWRYIGNAYLKGATPENNYTPDEPATVTLRQSVYDPYAKADEWGPEQKQVLVFFPGADNERYCLFFQDGDGNWKVFRRSWINLLADVKTAAEDEIYPPEVVRPESPANPQTEPAVKKEIIPAKAAGIDENGDPIVIDTTVEQYTFTFSTVPKTYEDIVQYKLDSPYKAMALLFMAYRAWAPDNPDDCLQMMDYLTNTKYDSGKKDAEGHKLAAPCSEYNPWTSFVKDRMTQNDKYRYIGNAYLGGAAPANDYTPDEPITVTVRQSVYDPYKDAEGESPELKQILIHIEGADNDRYGIFYQDQRGDWRVFSDHWKGLLADVQKPVMDILMPPETVRPETYKNPQVEPVETVFDIPAKAPGVDDNGESIIMDVTVKQHTFTFSTIPTCYEDIIQYKLDSPYKTMALMFMAFRTWTPQNKKDCLEMMDYLTNTDVDSGKKDADGRKLSKKFSEHQFWTDFVRDRMTQNEKWRYIGNAYLDGAMPSNDYTPTEPYTVTVRESVYNPYKPSDGHLTDPTLYQVLTTIPGADNDRYGIFYQDQRGDWRVFGDYWKGLLTDVKTPNADIPLPPEVVRPASPANPQTEPELEVTKIPGKAVDENDNPIDITLDQYKFTFSAVPASYEDIVQYKLDSPYKTMALLFLAFRTWTPEHPETCLQMLDYLTNTATPKPGVKDANGKQLCYPFSEYNPWIAFLKDRMTQNDKYKYIGNAYLKGAAPSNGYAPDAPITVVVRQSAYDPYKKAAETTPELKQVLVSIAGADNDRYALFYQDQRGDWRVFGDNWKGLLANIREPGDAPAVTGLTLDNNLVEFRTENIAGNPAAFVLCYLQNGQMVSAVRAAGSGGAYAAKVPAEAVKFKVCVLDAGTFRVLCDPAPLSK